MPIGGAACNRGKPLVLEEFIAWVLLVRIAGMHGRNVETKATAPFPIMRALGRQEVCFFCGPPQMRGYRDRGPPDGTATMNHPVQARL